jgi:TetR/AcrR family transcriptional regulator, transcriptional repressor for nem operon
MPRPKNFNEDEVLGKAMRLFWHKGFEATSIQDLVTHLGINKQSIYDTFGDKKKLYLLALNKYHFGSEMYFNTLYSENGTVREAFRAFFQAVVEGSFHDADKKGCFLQNAAVELAPQDEEIKKICLAGMSSFEKRFGDLIRKGQQSGELSKTLEADSLATFFFAIFNGLRVIGKITQDKTQLENIVKNALSVLE